MCGFLVQGGLIGLAAATVGLTTEASQHLEVSNDAFFFIYNSHILVNVWILVPILVFLRFYNI